MIGRLKAPLALLAATALAGCNDVPRIGDNEYIANTVETLLKECGLQSGPAVYNLLAQDSRRRFIQAGGVLEGCQEVTDLGDPQEIPGPDLYLRARVTAVERHGDHAWATVEVGERQVRLRLLDTGLLWFVSNPPRYEPVGVDDLP